MKTIALIGGSGMIGQRILKEALSRGHKVVAVVRDPSRIAEKHANLELKVGDVLKAESMALAARGTDVVVNSHGAGQRDPQEAVIAANALIEAIGSMNPAPRLIVVGGAASLEIAPGVQLLDTPDFPAAWKGVASAHREALGIYRKSPINWTYVSPAMFIQPGTRTGKYRIGTEQLVRDEKGESRISAEDYAVAIIDEIEKPQFSRKRFTVAY